MERQRGFETRRLVIVVLLFAVLALPLFVVAGCGKQLTRMEESQIKLQAMVAANARDLATISAQLHTGQGKINESIQTLDGDTQRVAAGVTMVQNEQRQFRDAVAAGHEGLNRRITQVQDDQHSLQGNVAQVSKVTQRTAADLTALARDQATLHDVVQASQRELTGSLGTVVSNQQRIQTDLGTLHQASQGLAGDIASLSTKNDTLYATVQDNSKQLTERLTVLASGHGQLSADIGNVHTLLQTAATDLTAAHSSLKVQLGATGEKLTAQITGLSASQQQLQTGLDALGGKAEQTAAELAETKASLQETLRVSRDVLTGQMAASLRNQETLQSDVRDLGDKADKLTANIGEVATGQTALQQTMRAAEDNLNEKTGQTIATIRGVVEQQASLQQSLTAANNTQEQMKTDLGTLTAMAGQTSLDVLAVKDQQAGLAQTMKTAVADLGTRTDRVAGELTAVAAGQRSLNDALNSQSQAASSQMAGIAESQQQLQSSMDTLTATTGQTALDVIAMTARQDAIQAARQSHSEAFGTQMAKLTEGQQQMQSSLEVVTATAGQASLDALALSNSQDKLGQAVQAGRQDMANRLTAMAQSQQNWSERLDNAQAKVATMTDNIAALEQQIAKLQTVLQTGLQGTAALLGTTGQQRQQFETKVSQDVQAVIDALGQLRQMQASLQEQITQVQKSTQGQADSLRSVIEQMKATPSATDRTREQTPAVEDQAGASAPAQPPAEVKVSSATEAPQAPDVAETQE